MSDFPFDIVHGHIARRLVADDLPKTGNFCPMLLLAEIDGAIVSTRLFPSIEEFFQDNTSKNTLGVLIRAITGQLPPHACLVMASEAWTKKIIVAPGEQAPSRNGNLEHDPDAESVVMLMYYRPESTRQSTLPIEAGRRLVYAPLNQQPTRISGRFSTNLEHLH